MSEEISLPSVTRINNNVAIATELVHSPDDGGWYLSQTDFAKNMSRTSVEIYRTDTEALSEWHRGVVKWEPWS
jgi:hypothetical protein